MVAEILVDRAVRPEPPIAEHPSQVAVDGERLLLLDNERAVQAPTDLLYTVGTFNITYGLLDDLDLNLAIPLVTLDLGLDATRQDTPGGPVRRPTVTDEHSGNISDMLLRAKYRLFETSNNFGAAVGAAGVRVRLPSGNARQGLGT